jgi:hypothetical protein
MIIKVLEIALALSKLFHGDTDFGFIDRTIALGSPK